MNTAIGLMSAVQLLVCLSLLTYIVRRDRQNGNGWKGKWGVRVGSPTRRHPDYAGALKWFEPEWVKDYPHNEPRLFDTLREANTYAKECYDNNNFWQYKAEKFV